MSKAKKKTKKRARSTPVKKRSNKKIIIAVAAACLVICAVAALIIKSAVDSARASALTDVRWVPASASNASGDSVELDEVYNVKYSNYSGELLFEKDGTFTLWVRPETDSGNHAGTYKLTDSTVELSFEDGSEQSLELRRDAQGGIETIKVDFEGYEILFSPEDSRVN